MRIDGSIPKFPAIQRDGGYIDDSEMDADKQYQSTNWKIIKNYRDGTEARDSEALQGLRPQAPVEQGDQYKSAISQKEYIEGLAEGYEKMSGATLRPLPTKGQPEGSPNVEELPRIPAPTNDWTSIGEIGYGVNGTGWLVHTDILGSSEMNLLVRVGRWPSRTLCS